MMYRPALTWLRRRGQFCRLAAVAFAVACQISACMAVPMRDAEEAQSRLVASVAVFCQSGAHPVRKDGAPHHRQAPDPALCRVLSTHAGAAAILDDGAFIPAPAIAKAISVRLPSARAPPALEVGAYFPRGPPSSV